MLAATPGDAVRERLSSALASPAAPPSPLASGGDSSAAVDDEGAASSSGSGSQQASSSNKRKRVVLSILEKQQVLQRLEEGEQPLPLAHAYGISRQQVSDIKKNRDRILSYCVDASHVASLRRKTLKVTSVYHPGVEQELYRWLVRQRLLGRPVLANALSKKAKQLFAQYSGEDSNVPNKTITNWLRHFKRAHGIKALNDEEIGRLPERFVPAMDMTEALFPGEEVHAHQPPQQAQQLTSGISSSGNNIMNMSAATAHTMPTSSYAEVYMTSSTMGLHSAPQPQPQHQGRNAPKSPLVKAVTTIHEINAQLSFFERAVAIKLDELDTRVEKLGFLVLPP